MWNWYGTCNIVYISVERTCLSVSLGYILDEWMWMRICPTVHLHQVWYWFDKTCMSIWELTSVSDLKLYEIQANRACNFIKFQARLESSRPHQLLRQQSCCQRIWNSTFLIMWTTRNCNALHESDNLSHMVILSNLFILRLAYAVNNFCSKAIS